MNKPIIAVWFSCGVASAVTAKKTIELYGKNHTIRILNNPIKDEHEDNLRFLKDCENWLGLKIESVVNKNFNEQSINEVFIKRKYMSGIKGAPCTFELKKKARQMWEKENHVDFHVLGFTFDEKHRHERFILTERNNVIPVLIDLKLTKDDCFRIINEAGISLPYIYKLGFPNANCIGCVKATSPDYWNLVREKFPKIFKERERLSREIGCKLTRQKGKRIFLDELLPETKGRGLKKMNIECGIFCEEKY